MRTPAVLLAGALAAGAALPAGATVVFDRVEALCVGGGIAVMWITSIEVDSVGYRIWRSTSPTGPGEIVSTLLPALGPGGTYQFLDTVPLPGAIHWYWVEEVTANGPGDRSLAVSADPRIPLGQGNVLRARRRDRDVVLEYAGAPAVLWRLFRDDDKRRLGQTALAPAQLSETVYEDLRALERPLGEYYFLRGVSPCCLLAGP